MSLKDEDRTVLEDAIMDAHLAADKFIQTGKEVHATLLEVNVNDALEYLEMMKENLTDDYKKENYKLHMLVPLQLLNMIKENSDESDAG